MSKVEEINPNGLFFKNLPKVELHRHLEGSLRLSTMIDIARLHNLDLPHQDVEKFRSLVQVMKYDDYSFQNFLSKFATLRFFYQSPDAIRRITREAIIDAVSDNVRYLELRFTPVALTRIKDFPLGEAMDWVLQTVDDTSQEFGIETKLIISVNRHESVELAEEVIGLAVDRQDQGVVGLDLAGNEVEFPGGEFKTVFRLAKESGMKVTIHAGEWAGAESVRFAINTFQANRIGHGVRVLENIEIVNLARENQIAFEVCPTSNFQSGVISSLERHPLPKMVRAGLSVTLNTDDPSISQIDLSSEYKICNHVFGFTISDLKQLSLNAVNVAFLPDNEKNLLAAQIEREFPNI